MEGKVTLEVRGFLADATGMAVAQYKESLKRDQYADNDWETGFRCAIIDLLQEMLDLGTRRHTPEQEFEANRHLDLERMDINRDLVVLTEEGPREGAFFYAQNDVM